jgi:hypothetical protein
MGGCWVNGGGEGGKAVGIERYITYITQCVAVSTKFSDIMGGCWVNEGGRGG